MSQTWIREYSPNITSEVIGHEKIILRIKQHISGFNRKTKPLFLYGGTGNGKTSTVIAVANELGLELVEINASDTRNAESMNNLIGNAMKQASLFSTGKIIFIDELEGLSGTADRGGIPALIRLIENSVYPVVMTSADAYEQKFKELRKISELVEYEPLSSESMISIIRNVAKKESVQIDDDALMHLARVSAGDARAAINDLQTVASGSKKITLQDVKEIADRNKTITMEESLKRVFKSTSPDVALGAFDEVDEDLDKIFLWVEENIPEQYTKPEHLQKAFDNLSLADVFFGRIRKWQYYRFYVYCYNLLTAGIAISKDVKYDIHSEFKPTSRLLKIWIWNNANSKKKAISEKIASKTHVSAKRARNDYVPYLRVIYKKNRNEAEKISSFLGLDAEEADWLVAK